MLNIQTKQFYYSPTFRQNSQTPIRTIGKNCGEFKELKYLFKVDKPNGIVEDLRFLKDTTTYKRRMETSLKFIEGSMKFLDEKIYGILGLGGLTTVFDIGNNRVLKISKENPFEYRNYNPKFDVPLLSKVEEYDGIFGCIQARAEIDNVKKEDVIDVKQRMKSAGFIPSNDFDNWRTEQVGIYEGRSVLLDSRCAVKQNNLFTRFIKWFDQNYNMKIPVYRPNKIDFNVYVHVDETPPPNYTLKEGWEIIKNVIKSWI